MAVKIKTFNDRVFECLNKEVEEWLKYMNTIEGFEVISVDNGTHKEEFAEYVATKTIEKYHTRIYYNI